MQKQQRLAAALLIVGLALTTSSVRAQQNQPNRPDAPYGQTKARSKQTGQGQLKASQIIGMSVKNYQDEDLGQVQDLIVDFDSYSVPCAIIAHGGALGIGRTKTAVPMSAFQCSSTESKTLMLSATKEQLQAASKTPTGDWAKVSDAEWTKTVDGFYGHPFRTGRFERQPLDGTSDQRLPVREPTEQKGAELLIKPNDTTLNQQVRATIEGEVRPEIAQNVQVTVENGVVFLSGQVENQTAKQNIDAKIAALPGVQRVENKLTVKNP